MNCRRLARSSRRPRRLADWFARSLAGWLVARTVRSLARKSGRRRRRLARVHVSALCVCVCVCAACARAAQRASAAAQRGAARRST